MTKLGQTHEGKSDLYSIDNALLTKHFPTALAVPLEQSAKNQIQSASQMQLIINALNITLILQTHYDITCKKLFEYLQEMTTIPIKMLINNNKNMKHNNMNY